MRQKSFFIHLLKNFMLTLCVPIVTVLAIYFYAENSIEAQITESSENSLNQFFSAIEMTVEEMRDTCITLLDNDQCKYYAYYAYTKPEKSIYQGSVLSTTLKSIAQPKYADVFVYFPVNDQIISGLHASTEAIHYYNSFYKETGPINRDAREWLAFQETLQYASPTPALGVLEKKGQKTLCVQAARAQYNTGSVEYMVMVTLDEEYLNHLIGSELLNEDMAFLIFDENRELLISGNPSWETVSLEGLEQDSSVGTMRVNGEEYRLRIRESDNLRGYYAIAISADYYAQKLLTLRVTCWIGILLSILLSIWIAWRNSIRSWNPFEALYTKLWEQNKHTDLNHTTNELEFIELLFQKEMDEKRSLIGRVDTSMLLQKEKALQKLLGVFTSEEQINDLLESNDIRFTEPCFYVCLIRMEQHAGHTLNSFDCEHALRGLFQNIGVQRCGWYLIRMSELEYGLIVNAPADLSEAELQRLLEEKYQMLACSVDAVVTTGVSMCKDRVSQLNGALEEARTAMSYAFFSRDGGIIFYAAVQGRTFSYVPFLEQNLSGMIVHYITSEVAERSPEDFVAQILALYGINASASIEILNCFRYEVLNALYKTMVGYQYPSEERYERLSFVLTDKHIHEFERHFSEMIAELCQKHQQSAVSRDVCSQARRYIDANYAQAQLSLDSIAEQIGCSASYLSRTFKQKYDISIIAYLSEVRIAQARHLLDTTTVTIAEIAERVGYLSSNTFVKSFKKIVGTTPAAYRAREREETGSEA